MAINLFDPQDAINSTSLYNGVPKYEDMFIFAELVAQRRGRTVLVTNGIGKTSIQKTGLDTSLVVNLLGQNQDKKSVNFNNFTTNWYKGNSSDTKIQFEGFGITNIKIVVSSSYVPQVNIEFVDVRGISFFERSDSPYRMLFDFPPPIFNLTVKGFYGKSMTYQLHLVKNNTKFDAATGNFIINSEFVGMTFAPLTDVLLRYIVNFGVLNKGVNDPSVDKNVVPTTTYALQYKVRDLYDGLQKLVNATDQNKAYNKALKDKEKWDNFFNQVSSFNTYEKIPLSFRFNGTLRNYINQTNGFQSFATITTDQYNQYIKSLGTTASVTNINSRIFISFFLYHRNQNEVVNKTVDPNLAIALDEFVKKLVSSAEQLGISTKSLIPPPAHAFPITSPPVGGDTTVPVDVYMGVDITDLYFTVYQNEAPIIKAVQTSQDNLVNKVDALVADALKIEPTAYNIFKILCDDVDYFFETLRGTVKAAEKHHKTYKDKILTNSSYVDFKDTIFAFPLVINANNTRTYPITISNSLPEAFPELILVNDFINSFLKQKEDEQVRSLRTQVDATGNNRWIPISPMDSIFGGVVNNSPYYGIDPDGNGVNPLANNGKIIDQVYDILLRRYYILSQFTFGETNDFNSSAINFYAQSEAINLANSTTNTTFINLLLKEAAKYKNNINEFYSYLNTNLPTLYNLSDGNDKVLLEKSPAKDIFVYRNKGGSSFNGVKIVNNSDIQLRTTSTDAIQVFIDSQRLKWFAKLWSRIFNTNAKLDPKMTKENIFYLPDEAVNNDYSSRYIAFINTPNIINLFGVSAFLYSNVLVDFTKGGDQFYGLNNGNKGLIGKGIVSNAKGPENSSSWLIQWSFMFTHFNTKLLPLFIDAETNNNSKFLTSLIYSSNFGSTLSPFSYIRNINTKIFNLSAIMVVPYYVAVYIGALVEMINNPSFYNTTIDYFNTGVGSTFLGKGVLIFADYHDVLNYLSPNDKIIFHDIYVDFMNNTFPNINTNVIQMCGAVNNKSITSFTDALSGTYAETISVPLTKAYTIINYSDITFDNQFSINPTNTLPIPNFTSLSNQTTDFKTKVTNNYFNQFFNNLETQMNARNTFVTNLEQDFKKTTGDEDIWTQTYYSFKNIADRWISGMDNTIVGYPFNGTEEHLINKFAFVDRAMNPIGHVMINPKDLADKANNDFEINVYTLMSQILSANGFEFFPLSNFLKFQTIEWKEIFRPNTTLNKDSDTAFVCMFIGGNSSYPNNLANGFINDGIDNLETDPTINVTNPQKPNPAFDQQDQTNPTFPYNQPVGFKVRYGENNQSIFYDVQLDSKEYPETNESLQILAKIAGDNKQQSPVPKGQNLYNVYENRSYKAQITMLGDMMIQPTEYFQLENIPMFSGAYMIIGVEHNITPNYMTTSFNGVKILRYPVPLVTKAASVFGVDTGSTPITSGDVSAPNAITPANNANNLIPSNQTLGMNTLTV